MKIYDWDEIKHKFQDCLLIGNGASIAVDKRFSYKLLYNEVSKRSVLNEELLGLFKYYDTQNFELILRTLLETNQVNKILNIGDTKTEAYYLGLKNALIKTIRDVHPKYKEVKGYLDKVAEFMCKFNTIFSLNYDLLVYWAMLAYNDSHGKRFKDCFVNGEFVSDHGYLRKAYGDATGATLVFYPHGSLFFTAEPFGGEAKLSSSGSDYLLDSLLAKWEQENYIPLFVNEGNTQEKLRAIRRNRYLNEVYDYELANLQGSLAIYGWSFGDQDEHIVDALAKGRIKEIAISVHKKEDDWEDYCDKVRAKIIGVSRLKNCEIDFFDAQSKDCWIY